MVKYYKRADRQPLLSIANWTSKISKNLPMLHKKIAGLPVILVALTILSACSVTLPELPSVPFINSNGNELTISGELTYEERVALYTGSVASLAICNDSAAIDCAEVVAQQDLRVGGLSKPVPFVIPVDADKILTGSEYSLRVTVTGATGRVSWMAVEPFTINNSSADSESVEYSLGTVIMVRPDALRNSPGR